MYVPYRPHSDDTVTNDTAVEDRIIIPIPKLKRKMEVKIKAGDWTWGAVDETVELPKRIWTGRNSGVMFRVLFVDPRDEFIEQRRET
jgi:ssDNA-binding replication factor A large subunit